MKDFFEAIEWKFLLEAKEFGRKLYDENKVYNVRGPINGVYGFHVYDDKDYETKIMFDKNQNVTACYCTCTRSKNNTRLCRHLYASVLFLNDAMDDKTLFAESQKRTIDDFKSDVEVLTPSESLSEKHHLSKLIIDSFKIFSSNYDVDPAQMTYFVTENCKSPYDYAYLFSLVRKTAPLQVFLDIFAKNPDPEIFKAMDLTLFPESMALNPIVLFFLEHSDMLPYLSESNLMVLFQNRKQNDYVNKSRFLMIALKYHLTYAIKAFFNESTNHLNFLQDKCVIEYLEKYEKQEVWLNCFKKRIESFALTRMEAAFLYPHFSDSQIEDYHEFFGKYHSALELRERYYFGFDPDEEYLRGYPMDRTFYKMLEKQNVDSVSYDLRAIYYLRDIVFTEKDNKKYVKRFRTLALALFRAKNPDFLKIICCLGVLYDYGDKIDDFHELVSKLKTKDFRDKFCVGELNNIYSKLEEKYHLNLKKNFIEYHLEA